MCKARSEKQLHMLNYFPLSHIRCLNSWIHLNHDAFSQWLTQRGKNTCRWNFLAMLFPLIRRYFFVKLRHTNDLICLGNLHGLHTALGHLCKLFCVLTPEWTPPWHNKRRAEALHWFAVTLIWVCLLASVLGILHRWFAVSGGWLGGSRVFVLMTQAGVRMWYYTRMWDIPRSPMSRR